MDNFLIFTGLLLLFIGVPVLVVWIIVGAIKKKKVLIQAILVPVFLVVALVFIFIGLEIYSNSEVEEDSIDTSSNQIIEEMYSEEVVTQNTPKNSNNDKQTENNENAESTNNGSSLIGLLLLLGIIIGGCVLLDSNANNKTPKYNGQIRKCPRCGGSHFRAFVENEVVIPGKVKSQTTLNMNPLKPFTVFNHKEKVVRREVTRHVSRFVCDECGNIFQ